MGDKRITPRRQIKSWQSVVHGTIFKQRLDGVIVQICKHNPRSCPSLCSQSNLDSVCSAVFAHREHAIQPCATQLCWESVQGIIQGAARQYSRSLTGLLSFSLCFNVCDTLPKHTHCAVLFTRTTSGFCYVFPLLDVQQAHQLQAEGEPACLTPVQCERRLLLAARSFLSCEIRLPCETYISSIHHPKPYTYKTEAPSFLGNNG